MTKVYIDIESIPEQPEQAAKALIAKNIETPKTMSKPETIQQWHDGVGKYAGAKEALIEETYRSTSFDGGKGEIISIAYAIDNGPVECIYRTLGGNETELLMNVFDNIRSSSKSHNPYFIGHYIGGFDLKFIFRRAVILGVNPGFSLPFDGRHGKDFYDTQSAWCGYKENISLDNLCKALAIEGKPNDIDGSKVWDFVKAGGIERVCEYNADDVHKVREIYRRLNFLSQAA